MNKKKGVLYVRVSTTKDEQQQSLEIQEQALSQVCDSKNIEIIDTYSDKASGTRIRKRKGMISLLYDAGIDVIIRNDKSTDDFIINKDRKPKFDYIIVKDIFRFGRNSSEAMEVIKELRKNKVYVSFINSGEDTANNNYEFLLSLLFNIAQNESHNTSQRVKFSKRHLAKQGKYSPARLPYGYMRVINSEGKKEIIIDEEQAKIVRFIYDRYKEDGGHVISRILNEKEVPTQQGGKWSDDKIGRIVSNSAYYGSPIVQKLTKDNVTDVHFHKADKSQHVQLFNVIPAIVTKEQFDELQLIKKQRVNTITAKGKRVSKKDVFFEKVYCKKCGARFVRHCGENQKVTYMCQTRRKYGSRECDCKGIAYNNLMKVVNEIDIEKEIPSFFDMIYRLLKQRFTDVIDEISEIEREFNSKLKEIDDQISNITRSFLSANDEMREELNNLMVELKTEKNLLLSQKENASAREFNDVLEQLENKRIYNQQIYRRNEHTFDERLDFVERILVDTDKVEVKIKGLIYADEMYRFNELAKGTKYEIPIGENIYITNPARTVVINR